MRWLIVLLVPACFSKPPPILDDAAPPDSLIPLDKNVAFVTSMTFHPSTFKKIADADDACMAAASGHLPNATYIAWVSTPGMDVVDRLTNSRGWVRPDGKPVADSAGDLVKGELFYPIRMAETGLDVAATGMVDVYTNTAVGGIAAPGAGDCIASPQGNMIYGKADAQLDIFTSYGGGLGCDTPARLYCIGIGKMAEVKATSTGRLAFITNNVTLPDLTQMNTECQVEGSMNHPGTYKAFVSNLGVSASQILTHPGPWVRVDGVEITADLMSFEAPLRLTLGGVSALEEAFTGALDVSAQGTMTCGDWMVTTGMAITGDPERSNDASFHNNTALCNDQRHAYCFED